jgi:hypothetical protein
MRSNILPTDEAKYPYLLHHVLYSLTPTSNFAHDTEPASAELGLDFQQKANLFPMIGTYLAKWDRDLHESKTFLDTVNGA